jgi:hypothetical protein
LPAAPPEGHAAHPAPRLSPLLDRLQHAAAIRVGQLGPVVMPKAETFLIGSDPRDLLSITPRQSPLDHRRLHRVHLVPVQFQMLRLLRLAPGLKQQVNHLSLELCDEARTCFRPRHQYRPHLTGRALVAVHATTKPGRAVDRDQMPPTARRCMVVDRARPRALRARRLKARGPLHLDCHAPMLVLQLYRQYLH